jgi:hypothetical protein
VVVNIAKNAILTLTKMTRAITIEAGAKVELTGIGSGDVAFKANTGTLILNQPLAATVPRWKPENRANVYDESLPPPAQREISGAGKDPRGR